MALSLAYQYPPEGVKWYGWYLNRHVPASIKLKVRPGGPQEVGVVEKTCPGGIYIGLGANLAHPTHGPPVRTLRAALDLMPGWGISVLRISPRYRTAPVQAAGQPWYVNAVAEVATDLAADEVLARLHAIEAKLGRVRTVTNAARAIDLDLLDFRGEIASGGPGRAILPHPRMTDRGFVLRPLADLAPSWRHPASGKPIESLLAALGPDQQIERLPPSGDLPFGPERV
jgi:2-amino-4-hydroxy-6-hydroxymethyldihydropteridine diphosphokinase